MAHSGIHIVKHLTLKAIGLWVKYLSCNSSWWCSILQGHRRSCISARHSTRSARSTYDYKNNVVFTRRDTSRQVSCLSNVVISLFLFDLVRYLSMVLEQSSMMSTQKHSTCFWTERKDSICIFSSRCPVFFQFQMSCVFSVPDVLYFFSSRCPVFFQFQMSCIFSYLISIYRLLQFERRPKTFRLARSLLCHWAR